MTTKISKTLALRTCLLLSVLFCVLKVSESVETVSVNGSGTTNPSKCIWHIMSDFMDRSKLPTRLTYRAVGSSTGIDEFVGLLSGNDAYKPLTAFGAGDVPIPTGDYNDVNDNTAADGESNIVHLPFVLGSISFFHNVPNVPDGPLGLNMTACLLAKIFSREIKTWDDPEILQTNSGLQALLPRADYPITVARRVHGSSSTSMITKYLHQECPAEWPETMVGKEITWPEDTAKCEGSGGMTNCIRSTEGGIGYMDSGHGWQENLKEIELVNKDGYLLSSRRAKEFDGIAAASLGNTLPVRADADFGHVDLLNKPGQYTWPIVAISYVYVRKNIKDYITDSKERGLLKLFLKSLYQKEYIDQCGIYGFSTVPATIRDNALAGIDMIDFTGDEEWTFEFDTNKYEGQGDYVISSKRRTYAEFERSLIRDDVDAVGEELLISSGRNDALKADLLALAATEPKFSNRHKSRIDASLIMSSLSICLWGLTLAFFIGKKVLNI
mmetsp:Transcript_15263/g.21776  ORF Transcript_15263/g.21776 Transcript_15263/m.21776 type:complete len:497 (+) Transcript_15263:81-1571(+)